MLDRLALSPGEIRALGQAALEELSAYYGSLDTRPVLQPTTSERLRQVLSEPLPRDGAEFSTLLETVREVVTRYSRHSAHPRFFGYISSPGTPIASLGSMLEAALAINVTCWRSAPAATELEHVTVNWLKEMLGLPPQWMGLLVSGGSMANFAGLAAARSAKLPHVLRDGLGGARLRAYAGEEGHFSVAKAAGMLGIGEVNVRPVRTNERLEMDAADLRRVIEEDLAAGFVPFCVAANAGSTATGAFDPLAEIAAVARHYQLWLHVDAAYGGFAALAPSSRHLFAALGQADSVALDPHKWLYQPIGCGCVLYKDGNAARAAFSHSADYTRPIGLEHDEAFAFWDYGPELSRPFRALDLWLAIKYIGVQRLADAVEENIQCARYFETLVTESGDFEMLAPAGLSVFCFRYAPRGLTGDLDALNERILVDLQRAGSSYLSNARVHGKFALRGCVLNYRTTRADMERLLEDVRASAARVLSGATPGKSLRG